MSIKELLTRILERITSPVVTRTYSNSVTFNNSYWQTGSIDIALSGYKPLGVVAIMAASNTVIYDVTFYEITSANKLNYTVRTVNGSNTSATISSRFDVLYTKVGGVLTNLLRRGCLSCR